jgi:hypothetical protein
MLQIDKVQVLPEAESVTIYGDDEKPNKYYLMPNIPRFRINDDGKPALAFYQYRNPVDRADGSKGGGLLICDVEFVVPAAMKQIVIGKLNEQLKAQFPNANPPVTAEIGTMTYTHGTAAINVQNLSNKFVEKVFNPGKPSLFGNNITPFSVELTDMGSTFFSQALQNQGGFVQVAYDLYGPVKLPPLKVSIWFNSSKFYEFAESFKETHDSEGIFSTLGRWLFGGSDDSGTKITQSSVEIATQHDWGGVKIDFNFNLPDAKADADLKSKIRDWAQNELKEAVKRMTANPIKPVPDDQKKVPENAAEFHNTIVNYQFDSFYESMTESDVIEWNFAPQGTLEPIVNLKDKDGNPFKWSDFSTQVDLNDKFFQMINVPVRVNADFADATIDSVDVTFDYAQGATHTTTGFTFTTADKVERFKSFIENDEHKYTYSYQVNYKGQSRSFNRQGIVTDAQTLTIDVGDLGILGINIQPGNLNFAQVAQAQVVVRYEDSSNNVDKIERQFMLDKTNNKFSMRETIFAPMTNEYSYDITYFMVDGKQYTVTGSKSRSPYLYVNAPFHGTKTVSLRAMGDLQADIQQMFVDLKYVDDKNQFTQTATAALNKGNPFFDWTFPCIDPNAGTVTYSGSIQFNDGNVETIPEKPATSATIMVGKPKNDDEYLNVTLIPDAIDFSTVRFVKVSLHYVDQANSVDTQKDFVLRKSDTQMQTWNLRLHDKAKKGYSWSASFFLVDGTTRDVGPTPTSDPMLVVQMPKATATATN